MKVRHSSSRRGLRNMNGAADNRAAKFSKHARTGGDVGEPSGLAAGLVKIGVALAHHEMSEDGVAVIVALDGDQGVVVLASENGDARGQRLRRKVSMKLGTLHTACALDDLGAGVVAVGAAARGIDADDVLLWQITLAAGDGRKEGEQLALIGVFDNGRGLMEALVNDLDVEDTVAGGEEATLGILGVFFTGAVAKVGAHLATKGDLRGVEAMLLHELQSSSAEKRTISSGRR